METMIRIESEELTIRCESSCVFAKSAADWLDAMGPHHTRNPSVEQGKGTTSGLVFTYYGWKEREARWGQGETIEREGLSNDPRNALRMRSACSCER